METQLEITIRKAIYEAFDEGRYVERNGVTKLAAITLPKLDDLADTLLKEYILRAPMIADIEQILWDFYGPFTPTEKALEAVSVAVDRIVAVVSGITQTKEE